jgi:hypothetical protein
VLHEVSFRGEISDARAELALQRFLSGRLSINERRPDGHAAAAWVVAEEFGWAKTYDAEYVALAKSEGCRLVTLDSDCDGERTGWASSLLRPSSLKSLGSSECRLLTTPGLPFDSTGPRVFGLRLTVEVLCDGRRLRCLTRDTCGGRSKPRTPTAAARTPLDD